jgi:iron(III) transport system substrate-binding protein
MDAWSDSTMNLLRRLSPFWLFLLFGCGGSQPRVVLYCAQDREFAEGVLADFTAQTNLAVAPKYDTEADKSVSLYFEITHEKDRPRCDIFWNNEILSTIRLQKQGLLLPYTSEPGQLYPHAADNSWYAFAGRARILIVNNNLIPAGEHPRSLLHLTDSRWKDRAAMARPQFGTSATQAACLFEVLGKEKAEAHYRGLKANGIQILAGNKDVAVAVGQGRAPDGRPVAVGVTDTDDAMEEIRAGRPVSIIFPDQDDLGTLFIPNSVAIIKGCPNLDGARQLVDHLLSGEVEIALMKAGWHFPMRRGQFSEIPAPELKGGDRRMNVDFEKAADQWEGVQRFLTQEFARP